MKLFLISSDTHLVHQSYHGRGTYEEHFCAFFNNLNRMSDILLTSVSLWRIWHLGNNCIQNFHLGRYIVGHTVENLVLRRRYTSPNDNFEYGYPHSNALLTFSFKNRDYVLFASIRPAIASCIKPLASCIYSLINQWKETLCNDVGFPTVYRRIYCRKFITLSNQTSRCICKCIRISFNMIFDVYMSSRNTS